VSSGSIIKRTLRDRRTVLIWWSVGVSAYSAMILAVWPVIDGNDEFEELASSYPESLKAMFGGSEAFDAFTTPAGFLNTYLFSMIVPFILVGLAVSMGAALLAGEEERGLLDLLLAHPVSRGSAVVQKVIAIIFALVIVGVLVDLIVIVIGPLVDLHIGWFEVVAATVGTLLYALLHGLIALLAGAVRPGKGFAQGLGWGVALFGYLLTVMASMASSLSWIRWFSPLNYATGADPLLNGFPIDYLVLVGACVLVFGATLVAFNRHDIS
jgi:ABC-2 type transport system permease protein